MKSVEFVKKLASRWSIFSSLHRETNINSFSLAKRETLRKYSGTLRCSVNSFTSKFIVRGKETNCCFLRSLSTSRSPQLCSFTQCLSSILSLLLSLFLLYTLCPFASSLRATCRGLSLSNLFFSLYCLSLGSQSTLMNNILRWLSALFRVPRQL